MEAETLNEKKFGISKRKVKFSKDEVCWFTILTPSKVLFNLRNRF
jgi:hypothetical protein